MIQHSRQIRFGLWYDFRNPLQWRQSADQLYGGILDQIAWAESQGFDDVWLSEHHFIEDGYLPSIMPMAAASPLERNGFAFRRVCSSCLFTTPYASPRI